MRAATRRSGPARPHRLLHQPPPGPHSPARHSDRRPLREGHLDGLIGAHSPIARRDEVLGTHIRRNWGRMGLGGGALVSAARQAPRRSWGAQCGSPGRCRSSGRRARRRSARPPLPRPRSRVRGCDRGSRTCLHDQGVAIVLGHRRHERPIDLELADRQRLELAEARVAGARVVDGNADAQRRESLEQLLRPQRLGHDCGLRHLEHEQSRCDVMRGEQLGYLVGQVLVEQAAGR